jgi:long-chain acyl-CoA synthetase
MPEARITAGTAMEHPWLKHYPAGVPAEIDPEAFASLSALLEGAFDRYGSAPAFTNLGTTLSYRELERRSRAFAAWLQQASGLRPGDRFALMMPNLLQYPIALFGIWRAGMVAVNVNPLYTTRELEAQLKDSGARGILVLENFAHVLETVVPRTDLAVVVVTRIGDCLAPLKALTIDLVLRYVRKQIPAWHIAGAIGFPMALREGRKQRLGAVAIRPGDTALLQYTGGTTGVPLGAVLTHRNLVANILQAGAWLKPAMSRGGGDIVVTALPLFHIFALAANCLAFLPLGAHNVLITNARDLPGFVAELKKFKFNFLSGVNTLFNGLLNTPGFAALDFSALRSTFGGGMAVQAAVAERWKAVTGCIITQGWGLTETASIATGNPIGAEFNGSIGVPIPSTQVSIRDDAGQAVEVNQLGEICVMGPQVMRGYWNRPEETAKAIIGGWLRTGDIGRMDADGFIFLEDRKKDMILVSGFNVYPNEVEGVAAQHPAVSEVAAVAQPNAASGEVVALFVVRKDPALSADALIAHCRLALTGYKVPKHVYFRGELPKTPVGKILRRALRDELRATSKA